MARLTGELYIFKFTRNVIVKFMSRNVKRRQVNESFIGD